MTPEQIDKEAAKIKGEYAYMDDMPIEGWMWEFIRRTKEYPALFEAIKKENLIDVTVVKALSELGVSPVKEFTGPDLDFYHVIPGQSKILTSIIPNMAKFGIPDYHYDYSCFETMKPKIYGLDPVRVGTFSELDAQCKKAAEIIINNTENAPGIEQGIIENLLKNGTSNALRAISPSLPLEKNFYVGISIYGNKLDIMKRLEEIVDQYIKPSENKTRIDKWKYYVLVYDLKKDRLGDVTIAKIFDKAFPKSSDRKYTKNEIKRWYDQAKLLIEAKKYMDYLNSKSDDTFEGFR